MKNTKNKDITDRRSSAVEAKAALLQAFLAAKKAAEPTLEARQAERLALAAAREKRRADREQAKRDEQARILAEKAERDGAKAAAAKAEADARELADKNRIAQVVEDYAARKAERDRRYASRKARQG